MLNIFISLLVIFIILVCIYYFKIYSYWKSRGITCVKPLLPIIGSVYDIFFLRPAIKIISRIYNSSDAPFCGFYVFTRPILMVRDPDLIKKICITDFHHFVNRGFHSNPNVDPLAKNIIHLQEHDWKIIRPKLTTFFNVNKIKNMFTIMNESSKEVMENLNDKHEQGVDSEFLDLSHRFMIDCIMKTLFGVNSNCVKDPNAEFRCVGKKVLGIHFIKHIFIGIFSPWLHSLFGITMCSSESTKLFKSVVCDSLKFRERTESNSNDFFQMLMQMKEEDEAARKANLKVDGPVIDENFIAGQVFMFFTAGFETPANTLTFCLYELTQKKDIQETIYREIKKVLAEHDNQLTYNALQDLKYLNQVVAETMRKYPALSLIFRQCTKDYKIPDTEFVIEAGTLVLIPTHGIHYDPKNYAKPEEFDPDRFSDKNNARLHPGAYLPFGIGPRNCPVLLLYFPSKYPHFPISGTSRSPIKPDKSTLFANINMKIMLVRILQVYEVSLSEKTKVPLGFNPVQFVLTPQKSGVWLKLETRKNK